MTTRCYYRAHWTTCPEFSRENASSAPWGEDDVERTPGYSCCNSADDLVDYMDARGAASDETPVVVFAGSEIGVGPDNEPLVMPSRASRPRWTTMGRVRAIVAAR